MVAQPDYNGKCYSRVNCERGYAATIELPVMEIYAFGNNGHYKYRGPCCGARMESRIVDDHGTNNNDYFISIKPRKLNSSGKSKGHSTLACYAHAQ